MTRDEKKPAIRFAGFTEPWEQHKLGEFCDMYNGDRGINYPNADDMVAVGIPFINAGDLQNGRVNLAAANHITRAKYNQLGGAKIKHGDIVYCLRGSLGKNAFIDNFNEGTVASSLVVIRPQNIDGKYLYHILNSDIEYRQRTLCDEGAAQPNLSARNLNEFDISVPSMDEQRHVSALYKYLDNLITLHQRKCDKLISVKKSMLEKMFPQKGAKVPEIRFAGFTDPWEQRKAKTIFKTLADKGYPELPVLSASQEFGMINRTETGINIHHDTRNEIGYKRVQPGQFVIHLRSFQGGFAHSGIEGITSPAYTVMEFQEKEVHYDYFWKYIFNSEAFIRRLGLITYGIRDGRSISFEDFSTLDFYYPIYEEQKRIGLYFQEVDNLITLHQRKLEKLKNIKKSLLEKMFV